MIAARRLVPTPALTRRPLPLPGFERAGVDTRAARAWRRGLS